MILWPDLSLEKQIMFLDRLINWLIGKTNINNWCFHQKNLMTIQMSMKFPLKRVIENKLTTSYELLSWHGLQSATIHKKILSVRLWSMMFSVHKKIGWCNSIASTFNWCPNNANFYDIFRHSDGQIWWMPCNMYKNNMLFNSTIGNTTEVWNVLPAIISVHKPNLDPFYTTGKFIILSQLNERER